MNFWRYKRRIIACITLVQDTTIVDVKCVCISRWIGCMMTLPHKTILTMIHMSCVAVNIQKVVYFTSCITTDFQNVFPIDIYLILFKFELYLFANILNYAVNLYRVRVFHKSTSDCAVTPSLWILFRLSFCYACFGIYLLGVYYF